MIDVYVISLNDRLSNTLTKFHDQGFEHVYKFNAIDCRKKPNHEMMEFMTPKALFELERYRSTHDGISSKGCVGCYLSHMKMWEKVVELNKSVIISEDDAYVNFTIDDTYWLKNYDFMSIENLTGLFKGTGYIENLKQFTGLQIYYISPKAAKILLKECLPIHVQVDWYIYYMSHKYNDIFGYTSNYNILFYTSESKIKHKPIIRNNYKTTTIALIIINIILLIVIKNNLFKKNS